MRRPLPFGAGHRMLSRIARQGLIAFLCILAVISVQDRCFAQSPPLDLSVRAAPGGVELLFSFSYQAAGLSITRTPAWAQGQGLQLFSLFFQDGNLPVDPGGGLDPYVSAGTTYTYSVVYPNDPSIKGVVSIKYAPACTFIGHCPAGSGQPPQYTINCQQPADFYTSPTATQATSSSTTSFSGVGLVFPSSAAFTYACVPIRANDVFGGPGPSSGLCSGFSQTVNVSNCPVLPPPKPITTCQPCIATHRQCIKQGNGFVCKGNAQ
ncbi:hypothetical protein [Beijerinckia sp. L45]|uniref:hypothetical protein n=1 Tax=Beijerinckia sp. L45 TaxID=1641855 RepID=UPI00131E8F43|nr:hypothetical protein [Beijerinckia sp. L45]